jgi:hypothetical protein
MPFKVTEVKQRNSVGQSLFGEDFFKAAAKGDQVNLYLTLENCPDAVNWKNAAGQTACEVALEQKQPLAARLIQGRTPSPNNQPK